MNRSIEHQESEIRNKHLPHMTRRGSAPLNGFEFGRPGFKANLVLGSAACGVQTFAGAPNTRSTPCITASDRLEVEAVVMRTILRHLHLLIRFRHPYCPSSSYLSRGFLSKMSDPLSKSNLSAGRQVWQVRQYVRKRMSFERDLIVWKPIEGRPERS